MSFTYRFACMLPAVLLLMTVTAKAPCAPIISDDDPTSIQQAIDAAYQAGQHSLTVPPGVYHIKPISGSRAHLRFDSMRNFTVDATGVTIVSMIAGRDSVWLHNCEDVTLRGATILRAKIPYSQGTVETIDPMRWYVDVRVHDGYPTECEGINMLYTYGAGSRLPKTSVPMLNTGRAEHLGGKLVRMHMGHIDDKIPLVVGDRMAWRGPGAGDIFVDHCARTRIENVRILGGAGFCVTEFGGDGGNYYNYTLSYPPKPEGATEDPLLASNADAFHSNSVRKGPTLENCLLEGMGDDGIPIHGWYALVMEGQGNNLIVDAPTADYCRVGDEVRVLGDDRSIRATAKVTAIKDLDDYTVTNTKMVNCRFYMLQDQPHWQQITLDRAVQAKFGSMIGNTNAVGSGFHIKDCIIRNSRTRAMLIKASDGVIEGNSIDGTYAGIIVCPEVNVWAEADYAHNVIIKNNTIRATGAASDPGSGQAGALTIAAYEEDRFVPRPGGHNGIMVTGNRFERNDGVNVEISSATDVTIRDNLFLEPMPQISDRGSKVGIDPTSLFWLTECDKITLSGNRVVQPGEGFTKLVTASSTATVTGKTTGVALAQGSQAK